MRSLFAHTLLECWKEPRHLLSCNKKEALYRAESSRPTAMSKIVIIKLIKCGKKYPTQKRIVGMTFDTQNELKANTQKIHKYTESYVGKAVLVWAGILSLLRL